MNQIVFYDPPRGRNDYLTKLYFGPLRLYIGTSSTTEQLNNIKNVTLICSADHLNAETVRILKENNNTIVGFSITDSSYISEPCRHADVLKHIDIMFVLTGIQRFNHGFEFTFQDGAIKLVSKQFLSDEDWGQFCLMRSQGRLHSLPYVPWEPIPDYFRQPWRARSQKVLMRGGHHMRRFILALEFWKRDLLDVNSGFCSVPYFMDEMRDDFKYCQHCRSIWKANHRKYPFLTTERPDECTNPMWTKNGLDLSDLGQWNNRCPQSFYAFSESIGIPRYEAEALLNASWLHTHEYMALLSRITFTSDLKWLFSIYAAQRFWDAAAMGCINLLPSRTNDQEYFPPMDDGIHYLTFKEDCSTLQAEVDESTYDSISEDARDLYERWIQPSEFRTNSNLLQHILAIIALKS